MQITSYNAYEVFSNSVIEKDCFLHLNFLYDHMPYGLMLLDQNTKISRFNTYYLQFRDYFLLI